MDDEEIDQYWREREDESYVRRRRRRREAPPELIEVVLCPRCMTQLQDEQKCTHCGWCHGCD